MPIKRYAVSLAVTLIWMFMKLTSALINTVNPSSLTQALRKSQAEHIDQKSQMILSAPGFIFTALYLLLAAYLIRRLFLIYKKKTSLFVASPEGGLLSIQKKGIFLLNIGFFIIIASTALFALVVMTASQAGGLSGVPLGLGIAVGIFFCFLSVILIEIGNYKANKLSKRDALDSVPS